MSSRAEISPGSQSQEPALSQQELSPKVRVLFNDFKQTLKGIPEFQQDLANAYFSPTRTLRPREKPLTVMFNRDLDTWIVGYFLQEKDSVLSECLKIEVHGDYIASETALRFKIVTLRIPYLSDKKNGWNVDISYDQRNLLVASSPFDILQNKTASAIKGAEQMLADLKAPSAS